MLSGRMVLELHRDPTAVEHSDTYRRRRALQAVPNAWSDAVVPLNLGLGTHYAWVYAGTPPQRVSVIADTGSGITAFPCTECENCGKHTDPRFSPANSSSLTHATCDVRSFFHCESCEKSDMCTISQSYMEGSSWKATVVEDVVYFGGANSSETDELRKQFGTRFMFGCQLSETGLFISQVADGIMGLSNNDNHLVAKLYREKKIPNKQFSLCFAPEGGALTIGLPDTSRHHGNITYAQVIQTTSHSFYGVQFKDIRIGNVSIEADPAVYSHGHFIVDSGTTDSYLPSSLKNNFMHTFQKVTGLEYSTSEAGCKGFTDAELATMPNITYILEGPNGEDMSLVITTDQYLLEQSKNRYCANIFLSEGSGGVIGANIMMDRDVIFDGGNQRVGFVQADCNYRKLSGNDAAAPSPVSSTAASTVAPGANSTAVPAASSAANSTASKSPTAAPNATTAAPVASNATAVPATGTTATAAPVPSTVTTPNATSVAPATKSPAEMSAAPVSSAPTTQAPVVPTTTPTPSQTTGSPSATPGAANDGTQPPALTAGPGVTPASTPSQTPATTAPVPSSKANAHSGTTHNNATGEAEHPFVLTVVGTVLALAFLFGVIFSCRRSKKSKEQQWSRVNENGDDDEDDDDEEFGLTERRSGKSDKPVRRSDDSDENDDEDEIFDRTAHDHEDMKHDTRDDYDTIVKCVRRRRSLFAALLTASDAMVRIPLKRRERNDADVQRMQQRIRRRVSAVAEAANGSVPPIVDNEAPLRVGYGTHYAELYLGIPPQRASVIVDTGSHLTALPCSSYVHNGYQSRGCGTHTDPLFDMAKSTTARYLKCHDKTYACAGTCADEGMCMIRQSYTEGSMWEAIVIDDLVWVGGFEGKNMDAIMRHFGFHFPVGCQTKETGLFITQKENGIMGLGNNKETIMSYMLKEKRVEHNIFSLCFGENGGNMVLGGIDHSIHQTAISYTKLLGGDSGWFPVKVKGIRVGDRNVDVAPSSLNTGKGVIVDSGTTDTFFVLSASSEFQSAFHRASGGIAYSDKSMDISKKDVHKLPAITIVLEPLMKGDDDVELTIPPEQYLSLDENGQLFGNFHFSERSGGVLGASTMMGYDVIFDMENKRIGSSGRGSSRANAAPQSTDTIKPIPNGASQATSTPAITNSSSGFNSSNNSISSNSSNRTNGTNSTNSTNTSTSGSATKDTNAEAVNASRPATAASAASAASAVGAPSATSATNGSQSPSAEINNNKTASTDNEDNFSANKQVATKTSSRFYLQVSAVFAIGAIAIGVVWYQRRARRRQWAPVSGEDAQPSTRQNRSGHSILASTADDGDDQAMGDLDDESPTRALSPPRRDAAPASSPRFTIGSDDEDDRPSLT
ncbi:TPA: hypothetical protein N0F65_006974 [Lagenidium giganteum]|uniref:Peptidase A1 domain-containing protein n=1 Tax=Lagenidium giganteum TaxID=4803 RepID=A0AAV2ZE83_9STRA|nr:TPA: hypothetical protein N0F65_006974 [Lagenidium giganteum]